MSAAGAGEGAERARAGRIPQDVQQQAREKESPVVSELLLAARRGRSEQVADLLRQSPSQAAVVDKHGRTCLHLACIGGHVTTALVILQSGALPIDSMTKRGHTALHEACQEGHTHLSLLLLSLGASLHSRSREGWTPLMCACSRGHLQLATILVAAGADVNDTTRLGLTPLHIAAWKGHTSVVKMLLSHGSSTAAVAHNGKTAQQLAGEEEHAEAHTVLQAATAKASQEPAYRISSLEGQLRLCQEKLAQAFTHHDQVLAAERNRRDERERTLQCEYTHQLEQVKARAEALQAQLELMKGGGGAGQTAASEEGPSVATPEAREDVEDPLISPWQQVSRSVIKSASSSDLLATSHETPAVSRQPLTTPTPPSSQSRERLSITDMVSECLHNPSSMVNIRSHLKADNFTPKIQRKFHYKATPTGLPAVSSETSPLVRERVRAGEPLSLSPHSGRTAPRDK